MSKIDRRKLLKSGAAAASVPFVLPRIAIAQADNRPTITVAVQKVANSNTLEVLREQSNVGARIFYSIYEGLIDQDYQGNLEMKPGVATSWRRIDDKTVELKLRQGVKFHNGDTMTAEDVVYTFGPERMFGRGGAAEPGRTLFTQAGGGQGKEPPPEIAAVAKRCWPQLDRIEIVDKETVRFHNKTPDVTTEGRIARMVSEIISRRGYEEAGSWLEWAQKPIATGPYKVQEFKADRHLILASHDEYWGGRPPIKELRFVEVPETASRINGLLSGQFDFACDIPPDQIATVEKNPRFEVQGGLIGNHRILCFDRQHPAMVDPRVRRAMTHAIDRQAIVETLWLGRTRVPAGLQWEYYGPMFVADWKVPEYDPKLAQKLLKEAGYKGDPIPFRVLNNYYTNQVSTAQIVTEMWKAVGLNVQIQMRENWQQIFDKSTQRGVRDWSNSAPFNDPVSSLVNQHGPQGQQQQIGEWTNAEFNTLSEQLETSTDRERRKAVFKRMLEIAEREDPGYTLLHQNCTFTAKRKDIQWKAAQAFQMDFRARNFQMPKA
ncbi:ABC transporter substrate-binding protein [Desertibaculum subflavum]|uniref:ABC transporter substrate-binding protein n=1 Tax=Desertibaculum subflavum TaxID=2268458 RepID=UPI000E66AFEB